MKTFITALVFTMSLAGPYAYADHHKCTCSKSCAEECKKGQTENCDCEECKCAETGEGSERKSCHDE